MTTFFNVEQMLVYCGASLFDFFFFLRLETFNDCYKLQLLFESALEHSMKRLFERLQNAMSFRSSFCSFVFVAFALKNTKHLRNVL